MVDPDERHGQRCHVCGGSLDAGLPAVRDPQTREIFAIRRCVECGLGHTHPAPADLAPYYGTAYHGGRHSFTERLCLARRQRFLRTVASPGRLLDFGCGDGSFLAAAAAEGWDVAGVEMNPRLARDKGLMVAEQADALDGRFDAITLWHSLEHLRAPRQTLGSLAARLTDRGRIIVAVPNFASWQARRFGAHWFHLDVPRHLFHFTPPALDALLDATGLRPVRRWHLEAEMDLFGWTQSALNAVLDGPNILFDALTGRGAAHGRGAIAASLALGSVVTTACAPLTLVGALLGRGAVTIVAAERA